jgi:small conductance mechanosensitive channel
MEQSSLLRQISAYLATYSVFNVLAALIIVVVGRRLAGILSRLLGRALSGAHADQTLATFVTHLSYYIFLIFVLIAALGRLGIETTSLVAVLGAAGLAIGLALQGSLSNFAAGVLIVFFKLFKVGDFIEAGGASGTVQDIQIFYTVLHTADNLRVTVPNDLITKGKITNYSANHTRRIDLTVVVSSSNDLRQVRQTLEDLLAHDARVLVTPAPRITFAEVGSNSVRLAIQAWVQRVDYEVVRSDLLEQIKGVADQLGVTIV